VYITPERSTYWPPVATMLCSWSGRRWHSSAVPGRGVTTAPASTNAVAPPVNRRGERISIFTPASCSFVYHKHY
jgi:hypothetical protein